MKASCYLVLVPIHRSRWDATITSFKIARSTQGKPSLNAGEAVVKVTLEAEANVFDPTLVAVTVEPRDVALAVTTEDPDTIEEIETASIA